MITNAAIVLGKKVQLEKAVKKLIRYLFIRCEFYKAVIKK